MVRSGVEPQIIEVQNTEKANDGIQVNLLVHWNTQQITIDDIDNESHQEWEYEEEKLSTVYQGAQSELDNYLANHEKELVKRAKAKADKLEQADKETLSFPTFKTDSSYYGQIAEIDVSRSDKKYLKVEKTIDGRIISAWCYADYSLLLAYQNDDIAVGDYVIVSFADEDLDKPYAEGKIVGI